MSCIVALIPARSGSKRLPGKNRKHLGGKPLIQWTVDAAQSSGIFDVIAVSSDDIIGLPFLDAKMIRRPAAFARDESPDIQWVQHALERVECIAFAILRPTSPFRTADTIRRAWAQFQSSHAQSLRAIEPVKQHPGKMWQLTGPTRMMPVLDRQMAGTPWHSSPTQTLPPVYVQNASLEIAWRSTVEDTGTIAGTVVAPFFTEGWEGFDINTPEDWATAEAHVAEIAHLARVSAPAPLD